MPRKLTLTTVLSSMFLIVEARSDCAQAPSYIRSGSIGEKASPSATKGWRQYRYVPIEDWVGKRVIFLPKSKIQYLAFTSGSDLFEHPVYEEAIGGIGRIVSVSNGGYPKVTIRMEDSGKDYVGTIYGSSLAGIVFLDEIDEARKEFRGKTLWLKRSEMFTFDAATGDSATVGVKRYSPVSVTDVVVGLGNPSSPVRFILRSAEGKEGFLDVALSGTNASNVLANLNHFEKSFFMSDPRKLNPWSAKIWSAIDANEIFIGMTDAQVKMSWGEPSAVNQTVTAGGNFDQWIFPRQRYVYLRGAVVTSVQY